MSKRFPIPEFDRDLYKNMAWTPPKLLSAAEQSALVARAQGGDATAYGCYAVEAGDALYAKFSLQGPHRHAVMCLLPRQDVRLLGRSWAWQIQRAVVLDSLDTQRARVLHEWKTPRPMNTRLGPDLGVDIPGGPVYLLFGHLYSDHWVSNRTLKDTRAPNGRGFAVISSSDESNNDFHACNVSFSWA